MIKFIVEIPVRVTRDKAFAVDHEPTLDRTVKFHVEADDEEEAVQLVGLLLAGELELEDDVDIDVGALS